MGVPSYTNCRESGIATRHCQLHQKSGPWRLRHYQGEKTGLDKPDLDCKVISLNHVLGNMTQNLKADAKAANVIDGCAHKYSPAAAADFKNTSFNPMRVPKSLQKVNLVSEGRLNYLKTIGAILPTFRDRGGKTKRSRSSCRSTSTRSSAKRELLHQLNGLSRTMSSELAAVSSHMRATNNQLEAAVRPMSRGSIASSTNPYQTYNSARDPLCTGRSSQLSCRSGMTTGRDSQYTGSSGFVTGRSSMISSSGTITERSSTY